MGCAESKDVSVKPDAFGAGAGTIKGERTNVLPTPSSPLEAENDNKSPPAQSPKIANKADAPTPKRVSWEVDSKLSTAAQTDDKKERKESNSAKEGGSRRPSPVITISGWRQSVSNGSVSSRGSGSSEVMSPTNSTPVSPNGDDMEHSESGLISRKPRPAADNLLTAAKTGDIHLMKRCLAADPNTEMRGMWGNTPLIIAAQYGMLEAAMLLLSANADAKVVSDRGAGALLWACVEGSGKQLVSELLKKGADVDPPAVAVPCPVTNKVQRLTPLLAASLQGSIEIVSVLLDHGADVHRRVLPKVEGDGRFLGYEEGGMTPLMAACSQGHIEVSIRLLQSGADPTDYDIMGRNALMHACLSKKSEAVLAILKAVNQEDRRRLVLQVDEQRCTVLHVACASSQLSNAVEALIHAGANLRAADSHGKTPLNIASAVGAEVSVKLLLEHGATPSGVDLDTVRRANRKSTEAIMVLLEDAIVARPSFCRPDTGDGPSTPDWVPSPKAIKMLGLSPEVARAATEERKAEVARALAVQAQADAQSAKLLLMKAAKEMKQAKQKEKRALKHASEAKQKMREMVEQAKNEGRLPQKPRTSLSAPTSTTSSTASENGAVVLSTTRPSNQEEGEGMGSPELVRGPVPRMTLKLSTTQTLDLHVLSMPKILSPQDPVTSSTASSPRRSVSKSEALPVINGTLEMLPSINVIQSPSTPTIRC